MLRVMSSPVTVAAGVEAQGPTRRSGGGPSSCPLLGSNQDGEGMRSGRIGREGFFTHRRARALPAFPDVAGLGPRVLCVTHNPTAIVDHHLVELFNGSVPKTVPAWM